MGAYELFLFLERRILAAAERPFAERGLGDARTDAITSAAGVSKALLYYYFDSKEHLYGVFSEVTSSHSWRSFAKASTARRDRGPSCSCFLQSWQELPFSFLSVKSSVLSQKFLPIVSEHCREQIGPQAGA